MRKENLISMVEDRKAELIDLVSRLIRINSENPTGTQREVVDFVEKYLEKAGIAYEETGENPDYPCVVARMGSEDGYSLIFNGHVDVVPAGDRGLWDFDRELLNPRHNIVHGRRRVPNYNEVIEVTNYVLEIMETYKESVYSLAEKEDYLK